MAAVSLCGLLRVTLDVIVYRYGKVASTSVITAVNEMRGVSAHKCHFFGAEAFRAQVKNPMVKDSSPDNGETRLMGFPTDSKHRLSPVT